MKNKNIVAILIGLLFASCGEDRRLEYAHLTAPNKAIESVMRENYYWNEDIPDGKSLNYFTTPHREFFKSLLSEQDANYSYLEDPADTEGLKSYGITFDASITFNQDTAYAAQVLYVESDSPAADAGLMRGDWIIKRNNRFIIKNRIDSLYKGGAIELTLGEYEFIKDENEKEIIHFNDKRTIQLGAARATADNPIHYSGIYALSEAKVGYLVYSHFTPGKTDQDETYNDVLRALSNGFKTQGVNEFILDLRYNTGGNLKSAQLLGSMLVSQEALGNPMCILQYNALQSARNEEWLFSNEILAGGSNLNLKRLYVITGSITSSTSDVLINALKPYMEVILVGQATRGNHTGTHPYESEEFQPYILHPVDCMIYNSENRQPASGFTPNLAVNELEYVLFPLGNPNQEALLNSALQLIEHGQGGEETPSRYKKKIPGFNTLKNIPTRGTSVQ